MSFDVASDVDITAVVVSWNTRDLLGRCLASIDREAAASGLSVETVVVDNASTDGSPAMVRERFPTARLIALDQNRGFAGANNLVLKALSTGAALLLNPDAELLPGALAALWHALHAAPHVGLVGALLLNPDGSWQSSGYRFPDLAQVAIDLFPLHPRLVASGANGRVGLSDGLSPVEIDHPLGACMLVRAEVVARVGLLDEGYFMYGEEVDWCRRIKAAGWTVLTAPAARVIHYGGQSTAQMPEAMFLQLHRSRARYFRRYHSPGFLRAAALFAGTAALVERTGARLGRPRSSARAELLRGISGIYRDAGVDDVRAS